MFEASIESRRLAKVSAESKHPKAVILTRYFFCPIKRVINTSIINQKHFECVGQRF